MSEQTTKTYRNKWPENPGYEIRLKPAGTRVRVTFNGETIADSENATLLEEQNHAPVYYFPRADLRMDRLRRTEHHSHCPYKGHCSYYSIEVGGRIAENAVWSYEDPYPEIAGIRDLAAFYPDRVDAIDVVKS